MTDSTQQINEAKNALLSYYSSQTIAHGAELAGFFVALLTLIQIFSTEPMRYLELYRQILLFVGIGFIMAIIVYTSVRLSLYGYLSSNIMGVDPSKIGMNYNAFQRALHIEVLRSMMGDKKRLLLFFPAKDFFPFSEDEMKNNQLFGVIESLLIGFALAMLLLILLW